MVSQESNINKYPVSGLQYPRKIIESVVQQLSNENLNGFCMTKV